jgi:hypothetical protein
MLNFLSPQDQAGLSNSSRAALVNKGQIGEASDYTAEYLARENRS